ncbi:MAG: NblA/ycf18 family protein [Scytolyngbya sp. HA4215-MV1]|jgi:hypothetical protein|nr:NblA/ycf18 family protein [Scytolyngbya sp. HA4215-MV1]
MLPKLTAHDFELTLEQQFILARYTHLANQASTEELRTSFLEITRQLMVKENLIRSLVKAGS